MFSPRTTLVLSPHKERMKCGRWTPCSCLLSSTQMPNHIRQKRQSHLSLCRWCCDCCKNNGCGFCCRYWGFLQQRLDINLLCFLSYPKKSAFLDLFRCPCCKHVFWHDFWNKYDSWMSTGKKTKSYSMYLFCMFVILSPWNSFCKLNTSIQMWLFLYLNEVCNK